MRAYRATACGVLLVTLTGCAGPTALLSPPPPGAEEPAVPDYPPAEISPDEPLLCADDADPCADPGELRWSLPLDGEYFLSRHGDLVNTRGRLASQRHASSTVLDAGTGILYYNEDDLVRAIRAETGEPLWTAATSEEGPAQVGHDELGGHPLQLHDGWLVIWLGPGHMYAGGYDYDAFPASALAVLDPADGTVAHRIPVAATSHFRSPPRWEAADGVVLVRDGDGAAAFELDTGAELWRTDDPVLRGDENATRGVVYDGVFHAAREPYDEARRIDVRTGEELSPVDLDPDAGTEGGGPVWIDPDTGELLSEERAEERETARETADLWFFSDRDGDLVPVDPDGSSPDGSEANGPAGDGPTLTRIDLASSTDGQAEGLGPAGIFHTYGGGARLPDGDLVLVLACAPDGLVERPASLYGGNDVGCERPRLYALNL